MAAALVVLFAGWLAYGLLAARHAPFRTLGDPPLVTIGSDGGDRSRIGSYAFLHSEAAFHFRTTLMFAADDYQSPDLLSDDNWQQYPDGIDAWREYGLLMEPVYGHAYRVLHAPGQSLTEFLLVLLPVVHALTVLLAYLLARVLGAGAGRALVGAAAYAFSPVPFHALLAGILVKETFSLLLLAGFLVAHFRALQGRGRIATATAAILLALFLISWHLAQFLAAIVLAATFASRAMDPLDTESRSRRSSWHLPIAYLEAALVAGFLPMLAARGFLYGPPIAPLYAWLAFEGATAIRPGRFGTLRRRGTLAIGALVLVGSITLLLPAGRDYSHVYDLLVAQVKHGFVKPTDPAALPFAVRLFWSPPFVPPTPSRLWQQIGPAGVPAIAAALWLFFTHLRLAADPVRRSLAFVGVALLVAWGLSERLAPVFWLVAPSAIGLALLDLTRRRGAIRVGGGVLTVLLVAAAIPFQVAPLAKTARAVAQGRATGPQGLDRTEAADRADLFAWITEHTPGPGSTLPGNPPAFAADIALSPDLLLYAGRPIVLNSQFENEGIRARAEAWLGALFDEDETDLLTLAQRYGARYLVIDRDLATATGRRSMRYMAGASGAPTVTCLAGRLHFRPESVGGLRPVYENARYRVFAVGPVADPHATWAPTGGRWWNPRNYRIENGALPDAYVDRQKMQRVENGLGEIRSRLDRLAARMAADTEAPTTPLFQLRREEAEHFASARRRGEPAFLPLDLENQIEAWMSWRDPQSGRTLSDELDAILDGDQAGRPGLQAILASHVAEPADLRLAAELCVLAGRVEAAAGWFAAAKD